MVTSLAHYCVLMFIIYIALFTGFSSSRPLAQTPEISVSVRTNNTTQMEVKPSSTSKNRSKELSMMAGSALPDCSHACGACKPCLRVTISFMCLESRDSEACPSAYRCMCRGKSFPVP